MYSEKVACFPAAARRQPASNNFISTKRAAKRGLVTAEFCDAFFPLPRQPVMTARGLSAICALDQTKAFAPRTQSPPFAIDAESKGSAGSAARDDQLSTTPLQSKAPDALDPKMAPKGLTARPALHLYPNAQTPTPNPNVSEAGIEA